MKGTPIKDEILCLIQRPEGFRPRDDWQLVPGASMQGCERATARLIAEGIAHPGKVSHKHCRYFGTAKEALDYVAANARPTVSAPVSIKTYPANLDSLVVDMSRARFTECPPCRLGWRAEETYTPMFSALKPGQYL
jgi:hypothetical protein